MIERKIEHFNSWAATSQLLRDVYDKRWARSLNIEKGRFPDRETALSKVRKRSKLYFRKIWATNQRTLAGMYGAFLSDPDSFIIKEREGEDVLRCEVLNKMVAYRRDMMFSQQSLLRKLIWAIMNVLSFGICVGKLSWEYNEDQGIDGPRFTLYPNEAVYLDLAASTPEDMEYIMFDNYMTQAQMEALNFKNIGDVPAQSAQTNQLRDARYRDEIDPLQNPKADEYPVAGRYEEGRRKALLKFHLVREVFYKDDGVIKYSAYSPNPNKFYSKEDIIESPYGSRYPAVIGSCLQDPHKMIGEGFNEVLEGPEKSINFFSNLRKDNVVLAMNKQYKVNRYGGVDIQRLLYSTPGGVIKMNDVNAVKEIDHPDVTQSSYVEVQKDEDMMDEMSGVTKGKRGLELASTTATVGQINEQNASAKGDLYTGIMGETLFRDFYSLLAHEIILFETDETVFRVANSQIRQDPRFVHEVYDFENLGYDCVIKAGLSSISKSLQINQIFMAIDRGNMSNQTALLMSKLGLPAEYVKTTEFYKKLLPLIGIKNVEEFMIRLNPPQQPQGGEGGGGQSSSSPELNEANDLQRGNIGGSL